GPRARRDVGVRVHHRVERVHLRERAAAGPVEADRDRLALVLLRFVAAHRLGRAHGRVDGDRGAGDDLLPARPAEDALRAHGRRGQGLVDLERLALACVWPGFPGHEAPDWVRRRLSEGLGGVCLFGWNVRDADQVAELTAALRAENPAVVVSTDEEGGDVTRLEVATGSSFPGNLALGVVDDLSVTAEVGAAIGSLCARVGVNLDLAPVADVNSNPDNPVIGVRSFGSDPALVARHVKAFVEGLQRCRVAACAKHFPGHGDTAQDSHLERPRAEGDLAAARLPFRAAIDAGVRAIMTAHIVVPSLDEAPATLSPRMLTGLLRGELGFDGLVVTDALEMRAVADTVGVEESAVRAIEAGADALCLGHDLFDEAVESVCGALIGAVRDGRLAEERLAEAARRVGALAEWAV